MSASPARGALTRSATAAGVADRPLRRDAERNRQRVLRAASEVFAEQGLEASLDEIAACAGVGVGTVYRRFPNKDVLVEALFEQKIEEVVSLAIRAAAQADGWHGLAYFLDGAAELQARDLGLRQVLFGNGYGRDCVARARARLGPLISGLVERAQAEGSLRADVSFTDIPVILLMLSTVAGTTRAGSEDLWRRYLALVLDGLRAGRDTRPLRVGAATDGQLDDVMRAWAPTRR
jgi:AcrR family transcriptional regulator